MNTFSPHAVRSSPFSATPLRVSTFDRVTGLLLTLLLFAGAVVVGLTIAWLFSHRLKPGDLPPGTTPEIEGLVLAGGHTGPEALDEPQDGEIIEPLEVVLEFQPLSEIISTNLASLDELSGTNKEGTGTGRQVGPGTGEDETDGPIPRWQRWEIVYSVADRELYARQLDFFQIEIGAVGGGGGGGGGGVGGGSVDYVSKVALPTPVTRSASPSAEKRLYMTWRSGKLKEVDTQLLALAGIATHDRVVAQFYPAAVEQKLLDLERAYSGADTNLRSIRKTIFGVRSVDDKFEYYVRDQFYRNLSK